MYNYWINVAEPDGLTFDGKARYVHVFATKPVQGRAQAEYAASMLRVAFPDFSVTTYRQSATYEEV